MQGMTEDLSSNRQPFDSRKDMGVKAKTREELLAEWKASQQKTPPTEAKKKQPLGPANSNVNQKWVAVQSVEQKRPLSIPSKKMASRAETPKLKSEVATRRITVHPDKENHIVSSAQKAKLTLKSNSRRPSLSTTPSAISSAEVEKLKAEVKRLKNTWLSETSQAEQREKVLLAEIQCLKDGKSAQAAELLETKCQQERAQHIVEQLEIGIRSLEEVVETLRTRLNHQFSYNATAIEYSKALHEELANAYENLEEQYELLAEEKVVLENSIRLQNDMMVDLSSQLEASRIKERPPSRAEVSIQCCAIHQDSATDPAASPIVPANENPLYLLAITEFENQVLQQQLVEIKEKEKIELEKWKEINMKNMETQRELLLTLQKESERRKKAEKVAKMTTEKP